MTRSSLPHDPQIIIQASSRTWAGGRDICLNQVAGRAAVTHLVQLLVEQFPSAAIVIAAPAFDRDGLLPETLAAFTHRIRFVFAHDASPLLRMLEAAQGFQTGFLRINALNMFVQRDDLVHMWQHARKHEPACIKFPDAYPAQLTFDYYSKQALQSLAHDLLPDDPAQVHPKYALFQAQPDRCTVFQPKPPSDAELSRYRQQAQSLYNDARDEMTQKTIAVGDTLRFHYELALNWIKPGDRVLDIACGGFRGPELLHTRAAHVVGADIDAEVIEQCQQKLANQSDLNQLEFRVADVTQLAFSDASFDAITSFETLEHVDETAYFHELARVLKPGGLLLLSTPQNLLGHIPINPQHRIEYSLEQLLALIAKHPFEVARLIGIKQGRVMVADDASGNNSFLVLRRW